MGLVAKMQPTHCSSALKTRRPYNPNDCYWLDALGPRLAGQYIYGGIFNRRLSDFRYLGSYILCHFMRIRLCNDFDFDHYACLIGDAVRDECTV